MRGDLQQPLPGVTRVGVSLVRDIQIGRDTMPSTSTSQLVGENLSRFNVDMSRRYLDYNLSSVDSLHSSNRRNSNRIRKHI